MRRALLLPVALVAIACAAPQRTSRSSERDRRANEILMHYGKIIQWRMDLGMPPQPAQNAAPARACAESCDDVCKLARYICDAKDQICRIAGEMGDDPWAREKCESARASCKQARGRCSSCEECKAATLGGCGPHWSWSSPSPPQSRWARAR